MTMKKTLLAFTTSLALATSLSSFSALAENGDTPAPAPAPASVKGGTLKFVGKLVDAPCAVDIPSDGQITDMGQYRTASLGKDVGITSAAKNFNIRLVDCSVDTYKNVQVKFVGPTVKGSNTTLALEGGANAAENVGVQILRNGVPVAVDGSQKTEKMGLEGTENDLSFQAQFISLAKGVTPGVANASAEFYLTYL